MPIDKQSLLLAIAAAVTISQLIDKLIKPLLAAFDPERDLIQELIKLWPFYLATAIGSTLAWTTSINFLPIFRSPAIMGRILSCISIGLGPSFLHDLKKAIETGANQRP